MKPISTTSGNGKYEKKKKDSWLKVVKRSRKNGTQYVILKITNKGMKIILLTQSSRNKTFFFYTFFSSPSRIQREREKKWWGEKEN